MHEDFGLKGISKMGWLLQRVPIGIQKHQRKHTFTLNRLEKFLQLLRSRLEREKRKKDYGIYT
jgi:hypothetical protein